MKNHPLHSLAGLSLLMFFTAQKNPVRADITFVDQILNSAFVQCTDVALCDLDGDGDLDLVFGCPGGPNQVWLNQGGSAAFVLQPQALEFKGASALALGNLDQKNGTEVLFLGTGENPLTQVWTYDASRNGLFKFVPPTFGNSHSSAVALGDVDGDGDIDAVIVFERATQPAKVWLNDGSAHFVDSTQRLGSDVCNAVNLADADNDNDLDLFIATNVGVKIWINQGGLQGGTAGRFLQSDQVLGDSESRAVAVGDIDGDKFPDVIVATPTSIKVWISQGVGLDNRVTFTARDEYSSTDDNNDLVLGDLDNDGDLDLFVMRVHAGIVFENDGHGAFSHALEIGNTFGQAVALGDLNGDGRVDAVLADSVGPNKIALNSTVIPRKFSSKPAPDSLIDFGRFSTDAGDTRDTNGVPIHVPVIVTETIQISNTGAQDLEIQSLSFLHGGIQGMKWSVSRTNAPSTTLGPPPYTIAPGAPALTITLRYTPPRESMEFEDFLEVVTNDRAVPTAQYRVHVLVYDTLTDGLPIESTISEFTAVAFGRSLYALSANSLFLPPEGKTVILDMDTNQAHRVLSPVPSFLGGGSVELSRFSGAVTVSLQPIPGDPQRAAITIESGRFIAASVVLPSGIESGTNIFTFARAGSSGGLIDLTTGEYNANALGTIVNNFFPQGFSVRGLYSGRFNPQTGRVSLQSNSTDSYPIDQHLRFVSIGQVIRLMWMSGTLEHGLTSWGPWTAVTGATSPYTVNTTQPAEFFRVKRQQ